MKGLFRICVFALCFVSCKEQVHEPFVPVLPGEQKFLLSKVIFGLKMDLDTKANREMIQALDTFSHYCSHPGFPAFWPAGSSDTVFVTGSYAYNRQERVWLRQEEDTCVRLNVSTTLGNLEMTLAGSGAPLRYTDGRQVYVFPARTSMQFRKNGQVRLRMSGTFKAGEELNPGELTPSLCSEMRFETDALALNQTSRLSPDTQENVLVISQGTRTLLHSRLVRNPNRSMIWEINVKNQCFIHASVDRWSELEQALADCATRFPEVLGEATEAYCTAVCDTLQKYVCAYLNFDYSQTPAVEIRPGYSYESLQSGAIMYDFFPVMRFSDGSLASVAEVLSYRKWMELQHRMNHLYRLYQ